MAQTTTALAVSETRVSRFLAQVYLVMAVGLLVTVLVAVQVSGSSGCNNYSGTYTAQESSITSGSLAISALSGGQRLCADDVMALEARLSATRYSIHGDTLTISTSGR
jgi:hypothetical protein